ncbi:hypothetical protein OROMI_014098 [Orobanche minor]
MAGNIFLDLNEPPYEEGFDDENEHHHQEACEEENEKVIFEPFVGQCFLSEEETYVFYQNYTKKQGFSIRKARFDKNKEGNIKRRDFVCHRAGLQPSKILDPFKNQRNTGSNRCGCKAHMRVTLKKIFDIFPEEWHVSELSVKHNHELLSQEEVPC